MLRTATAADGTDVAVEVAGSGPPLVLLHGGGVARQFWSPVRPYLAETIARENRAVQRYSVDDVGVDAPTLLLLGERGPPTSTPARGPSTRRSPTVASWNWTGWGTPASRRRPDGSRTR